MPKTPIKSQSRTMFAMPPERAVAKLYAGEPSTRMKQEKSSFPMAAGHPRSQQSA
jgi:hypothetical protein